MLIDISVALSLFYLFYQLSREDYWVLSIKLWIIFLFLVSDPSSFENTLLYEQLLLKIFFNALTCYILFVRSISYLPHL